MLRRQRLLGPAPHTMLRIVFVAVDAKTQTLSDSLARRTGGSDSPLMRLLTFAPLSRCSLGPLGPGPAARALLAFGDGQASPRSHPSGPHSSRPLRRDGQSDAIPLPTAAITGPGWGGQSDGYRTRERTVARFVGRVQPKRSRTNRKPRGRVMVTRRGYGTHQRPVALCAWAGLA